MDQMTRARDAMDNIKFGVHEIVDIVKDAQNQTWTYQGDEQVASFGYNVTDENGKVKGTVSIYVHLFDGETPQEFLGRE